MKGGDDVEIVNTRIKELRESLGLSQEEFGKSIGLSKSGISNIESGNRAVKESYVELICIKYKVNRNWLMYENSIGQQYNEFESFIDYLKSLGYFVKIETDEVNQSHQEDVFDGGNQIGKATVIDDETYTVTISNEKTSATFIQKEFEALQHQNKANIDGAILLQSQKNKNESSSAATENDSDNENTI